MANKLTYIKALLADEHINFMTPDSALGERRHCTRCEISQVSFPPLRGSHMTPSLAILYTCVMAKLSTFASLFLSFASSIFRSYLHTASHGLTL